MKGAVLNQKVELFERELGCTSHDLHKKYPVMHSYLAEVSLPCARAALLTAAQLDSIQGDRRLEPDPGPNPNHNPNLK